MHKGKKRLLSGLLALLLTLQLCPVAYAEGEEAPEENAQIVTLEEETIPTETPEEEPQETAAAETDEEAEGILVVFTFPAAFSMTLLDGETAVEPVETGSQEAVYSLAPGEYAYTARVRGHVGTAQDTVTVTEDTSGMTIAVELEAYPMHLPGLPLDTVLQDGDFRRFLKEYEIVRRLSEMVPGVDYVADEVICHAETEAEAQLFADAFGGTVADFNGFSAVIKLDGLDAARVVEAAMNEALLLPAAEPNYLSGMPDPEVTEEDAEASSLYVRNSESWRTWYDSIGNPDTYLRNPSASDYLYAIDRMNVYKAWGIVTGSASVRVAILDSGIANHSDIANIKGKGYASAYGSANDDDGHGTHCAGILAATMGNGTGVAGIASGVSLYVYKVLGSDGRGSEQSIISGIRWAVNTAQADVISMSLGSRFPSYEEEQAIRYAINSGATVVCGMGNDGSNAVLYPAAYNIPGLIAVAASDASNARASYSNYGSWADIMAPGSNILSTSRTGGYVTYSGTSMATPAVAGACALYMSKYGHRSVSPKEMERLIKSSKTNGVLDVYKLVSKGTGTRSVGYAMNDGLYDVTALYEASEQIPQNVTVELTGADRILYTLDGTMPGCINGEAANGRYYEGGISLEDCEVGEQITVNAAAVNEEGDVGEVLTLTLTVAEPVDTLAVTLDAPETLESGASAALTLRDYRGEALEHVLWTAETEDGTAVIDADGVLTVTCEGVTEVLVRAQTEDGRTAEAVVVASDPKAANISGIDGPAIVLAGKSTTFKAIKNVSSASVTWTISDNSGNTVRYGYASISSKGVLKVDKNAVHGAKITIKAISGGYSVSKTVTVNQPVTKVHVYGASGGYSRTYSSKTGELTNVVLYSTQSPNFSTQNAVTVNVSTEGNSSAAVVLTTTSKLVTISGKKVTAVPGKTGTATITVKANDGSGKTLKFKVKVVNPVSRLDITTNAAKMNDSFEYILGIGKSASNKAVAGEAYGKPSNKKVAWHATLYCTDGRKWTEGSSYFSLSSSGKLKINSSLKNDYRMRDTKYSFYVDVYAVTTDGTNLKSNTLRYYITAPVTKITFSTTTYRESSAVKASLRRGESFAAQYNVYTPYGYYHYYNSVTVSSSNPKVASVTYAVDSSGRLINDSIRIFGISKGSATITVKANDGSGKKATVKVTVR